MRSRGKALRRAPQSAKYFDCRKIRTGTSTVQWTVEVWETQLRGLPKERLFSRSFYIRRHEKPHARCEKTRVRLFRKTCEKSFKKPLIGFLRLNSPLDCLAYLPDLCVGKVFRALRSSTKALPLGFRDLLKKGRSKTLFGGSQHYNGRYGNMSSHTSTVALAIMATVSRLYRGMLKSKRRQSRARR